MSLRSSVRPSDRPADGSWRRRAPCGARAPIERVLLVLLFAALAVALLPLVPSISLPAAGGSSSAPAAPQATSSPSPAALIAGPVVAKTPSTFWSVVVQTNNPSGVVSDPTVHSFLGSTPFRWVRYDSGTDQCNWATDTMYTDSGTVSGRCALNISALKTWCASLTPRCHAILTLPGENNNSVLDAAIARYIVTVVGFQPDYWAIGNEPTGWTHYGIPWLRWSPTDHSTPTALAYAVDVRAAIGAVSAVDPGAKFIGVEAACPCNGNWFQAVMKVDGPLLSALGVHMYPSTGSTSVSLAQFFSPLNGATNVSNQYAEVRASIAGQCPTCSRVPILINEFNAGPGWSPSNLGGTYPNAVFLAASVAQALRANVTQLTVFNLQTWSSGTYGYSMIDSRDVVGPTGELFSGMLSHLAMGSVAATEVQSTVGNLWSVLTANASRQTALVVNANVTQSVQLTVGDSLAFGRSGTAYRWTPGDAAPQTSEVNRSGSYLLPPESILLLDAPAAIPSASKLAAWISANRTQGDPPFSVAFSSVVQGGEAPFSYQWQFGDGASSNQSLASHTYTAAGIYSVSLTVNDSAGHRVTAVAAVTVGRFPLALSLNSNVSRGPAPLCIGFVALPTGGTGPYTTSWTFGDNGSGAAGAAVQHCYTSAGNYTVIATSTDVAGGSVSAQLSVVVGATLQVTLRASENPVYAGDSVQVSAATSGGQGGVSLRWSDNGTLWASNNTSVTQVWPTPGVHQVSVTVRDSQGNTASASLNLTVEPSRAVSAGANASPNASHRILWATGMALIAVGVGIAAVLAPAGGRRHRER